MREGREFPPAADRSRHFSTKACHLEYVTGLFCFMVSCESLELMALAFPLTFPTFSII